MNKKLRDFNARKTLKEMKIPDFSHNNGIFWENPGLARVQKSSIYLFKITRKTAFDKALTLSGDAKGPCTVVQGLLELDGEAVIWFWR